MENLDERQMWAARYLGTVLGVSRERVPRVDAIRMAIFVLYLELVGRLEPDEFRSSSTSRLAEFLSREYAAAEPALGPRHHARLNFHELGEEGLARLMQGALPTEGREDKVHRFDYLIEALLEEEFGGKSKLRTEQFVANFSRSLVRRGDNLLDLGSDTSARIGTCVQANGICLPNMMHGARFEVLLSLAIHGCAVREPSSDPLATLRAADFCLYLPHRGNALTADLRMALTDEAPGESGLTLAFWFAKQARPGQVAVTLLSLRDCRASGVRKKIRRDLISTGSVRAVVELPRRVAAENRQFLLMLEGGRSEMGDEDVLFVDGRACDVLRDEPLDRIAAFTSIPIIARRAGGLDRIWPDWRKALGPELALRASRMFLGEHKEARGLYCSVPLSSLLNSESASVEPSAWIQPMGWDNGRAKLDDTPLRELLDSAQPCCIYVIGDNGVGKSFLLRGLLDHYLQAGRAVCALSSTASDRFPAASKELPGYRYLGGRTTATGSNSRVLARQMLELLQAIHQEPDRVAVLEKASELVGFKGKHFVLPAPERESDTLAALRSMDEVGVSALRKGDRPGFQRSETTIIVPFDHLSSGEQQMLLLLARLVAHATPEVLFVVDEPEASLHVAWQRALPGVLDLLRDSFQLQFAIATHSPVLLSAALSARNHRFAARGGLLEPLSGRAGSVESILFEGFGTYTESNREVHERCAEIVSDAIERVNMGDSDFVKTALGRLAEMRNTVEKSIPSLGAGRTQGHLRLIEHARMVLEGLGDELAAFEVVA